MSVMPERMKDSVKFESQERRRVICPDESLSAAKEPGAPVGEFETSSGGISAVRMFDSHSEVLLPRHKRAASGCVSGDVLDMSADDIETEIQRVKAESAEIKRHLAVLSGTNTQLSSESAVSVDDSETRQPFQHVTTRDDRRQRVRQPTVVRQPSCSPTVLVRQLPGRQPSAVRQLNNASSSSTPSIRHQYIRQPQLRSPTKVLVRQHKSAVGQLTCCSGPTSTNSSSFVQRRRKPTFCACLCLRRKV